MERVSESRRAMVPGDALTASLSAGASFSSSGKRTALGGEPGRASLDGVMLFRGVTPHHPWPLDAASPLLWDGQLFKAKA